MMPKKIISIIKVTSLMWVCVLIPLLIGVNFIKSSFGKDIQQCMDAFIHTEGINLSRCMALKFENIPREFEELAFELESENLKDARKVTQKLQSLREQNSNIVSLSMYRKNGKFLASTEKRMEADLENASKQKQNDQIVYSIGQQENGTVVISCRKLLDIENESFYLQMVLKWEQYEKYMDELQPGIFPRAFYVISPDCKRYVSQNSLPKKAIDARAVVALGIHLADKIQDIKDGFSDIKIESINFRVFRDKIKIPETMKGNDFFIVTATDSAGLAGMTERMFHRTISIISIIVTAWLMLCLIVAKFYYETMNQLTIANTITDSTPLATVVFRASDGKITKINYPAITLFRITKENMASANVWNFFAQDHDKGYVSNAISSGISVLNYEVLLHGIEGANFWSICSANPIDIGEKHVVFAVLDINNRKEMEKKLSNNAALLEKQIAERTADLEIKAKELEESNSLLEKAKKTADNANDAKSKFLTNVSNELKTPINAIIGYGEILQEEALDRKDTVSSDDLQKIIGSAKHLLSLIDEILDLSKIEAGKTQLFFKNIDISNIIEDVEGITMPLITENNNSLLLEYPKNIGAMYTDVTKLRQCILNLLSNAAKFTEFGKITLRASPIIENGIDYIKFDVIDTGLGIDPDRIDSIFNPFQENNSTKSGAGLGLSITKKYTELMGGMISVESEIGVGSKFTIRIPRTCIVKSNEFLEVKNQSDDEIIDDSEEKYDEISDDGANSFIRRSDSQGEDII